MADTTSVWSNFIENLQIVLDQLRSDDERKPVADTFDEPAFWKRFGEMFKALSHEATKLSIAYSSLPVPDEKSCKSLQASVEKVVLAVVSLFYTLPRSQGKTLLRSVRMTVITAVEGLKSLTETIATLGVGSPEQLQLTGIVWDETDRFSSMPKTNQTAVVGVMKTTSALVSDALQEIEEAMNCEDDADLDEFLGLPKSSSGEAAQSESDKALLGFGQGLIKCTKSILKKSVKAVEVNGDCKSQKNVNELDELADLVERLSPAVDECASSLYPPLQCGVVCSSCERLHQLNTDILNFIKHSHMTTEDDKKWVDFLLKASLHNHSKIEGLASGT